MTTKAVLEFHQRLLESQKEIFSFLKASYLVLMSIGIQPSLTSQRSDLGQLRAFLNSAENENSLAVSQEGHKKSAAKRWVHSKTPAER